MTAPASQRVVRVMFYGWAAIGLVFFAASLPVGGGVLDSLDSVSPATWLAGVLVIGVGPLGMIALARWGTVEALRVFAILYATVFIMVQLAWPFTVIEGAEQHVPFIGPVNAMPLGLIALFYRRWPVMLLPVMQGVIVAFSSWWIGAVDGVHAIQDGLWALVFTGSAMALSGSAAVSGLRLDEALTQQREAVSRARAAKAQREETARLDALIHDDVMSVLVTARSGADVKALPAYAEHALAEVSQLAKDRAIAGATTTIGTLTARLRAGMRRRPRGSVSTRIESSEPIASAAASAMTEAAAEAMRNATKHAPGAALDVLFESDAERVRLVLSDDGPGFDPNSVGPTHLGIRTSIKRRMDLVEGGSAAIVSAPGAGTTVTLTWSRP